jgi:hypothetical protein
MYQDQVAIGGSLSAETTVQLNFSAISEQSAFFNPFDCDLLLGTPLNQGILGMGWSNGVGDRSYADQLNREFSMQICARDGQMWIGAPNASYFTAAPKYANITHQSGYWAVKPLAISFDGLDLGFVAADFNGGAIVDTGSTKTSLPRPIFDSIVNKLKNDARFTTYLPSSILDGGCSQVQTRHSLLSISTAVCADILCLVFPIGLPI